MKKSTQKRLRHYLKLIPRTRKGRKPPREPIQNGLFGGQTVTESDIRAWLLAVPKIDPDGPRAAHYVIGYNVVEKIARHKAAGTFDAAINPPRSYYYDLV